MRKSVLILCYMILFCPFVLKGAERRRMVVDCGDWIELSAKPFENYHFVQWNDGDTSANRQVQVHSDYHYVAFFGLNCGNYAELPIVCLYDWLLMLDVRTAHDLGYYFNEENVNWYRVKGSPDNVEEPFPQDDEWVCTGYYLTINQNLWATGDYYAVVDVSSTPSGQLCSDYMCSQIAHFSGEKSGQPLSLAPTNVLPGEQIEVKGLDPGEVSTIFVYDVVGQLVSRTSSQNATIFHLEAAHTPGCYHVMVLWKDYQQTFRYLVHNQ